MGYDPNVLSDDDQKIREDAREIRRRLLLDVDAEDDPNKAISDADGALIPLFPDREDDERPITTFYNEPPASADIALLFSKHVEHARKEQQAISFPSSIHAFRERMAIFFGPLLRNFPMENVVIAGGSVLQCLQGTYQPHEHTEADVDIFLVTQSKEEAMEAFERIFNFLKSNMNHPGLRERIHTGLLVVRSPFAITFVIGNQQRNIQLVLVRHKCVADVVFNFDIDCCQVAYNGKQVFATPSALRALRTGMNLVDPERRHSNDYEFRLAKYAERGFLVGVPGLDIGRIKTKYIRNSCFAFDQEGALRKVMLGFPVKEDEDVPSISFDGDRMVGLPQLLAYSTITPCLFQVSLHQTQDDQERIPVLPSEVHRWGASNEAEILGFGNYLLEQVDPRCELPE